MISRNPVIETSAEAALVTGIGIDIGAQDEVGPIAAHAYLRLKPCIPVRPPVVDSDGNRGFGGQRIIAGDGELLDLAIGDNGADFVDAVGAVAAAVAHRGP